MKLPYKFYLCCAWLRRSGAQGLMYDYTLRPLCSEAPCPALAQANLKGSLASFWSLPFFKL